MPSEVREHRKTDHSMEQIYKYISPGVNEGISFGISRLTDDIFTTSFLGGGDISRFTPSGARGSIKSQDTIAFVLNSLAGPPQQFTFDLSIDLNTAKATLGWTPPGGTAQSAKMSLDYVKTATGDAGPFLAFDADEVSDNAVYTLSLIML
ncbi:MAG TPA: hypothetical protein VGX27_14050 [Candidatus Dormibacteraeota bacterium]|nr:hypothetical protein [Candidatus Dormibacteraeota bacterium]